MWYYVTKRILATLPVMGVVAVIVFLLLRLSPGDPAAIIAGDDATSEDIAKIREHLGLDRPVLTQFVRWIGHLATGDFGNSIYLERPVLGLIMERVEPTLALSVSTIIFAVVLAVPIGVLAAWRAGTWIDQAIMALSVLAFFAVVTSSLICLSCTVAFHTCDSTDTNTQDVASEMMWFGLFSRLSCPFVFICYLVSSVLVNTLSHSSDRLVVFRDVAYMRLVLLL